MKPDVLNIDRGWSQRSLLGEVFSSPGLKQSELHGRLDINQSTASRLVDKLCKEGILLRDRTSSSSSRGQPSPKLSIAADFAYAAGLSLAGDSWSICIVDSVGTIRAERSALRYPSKAQDIVSLVRPAVEDLMLAAELEPGRMIGLGVSITGFRVPGKATFNTPMNLNDFALIDIEQMMSDATGIPCRAENDGKAATLAEAMMGSGQKFSDFSYIYFGKGVGGGVVIDGKLHRGRHGNAGEFGSAQPLLGECQPASLERLREICVATGKNYESVAELAKNLDCDCEGVSIWLESCRDSLQQTITAAAAILDTEAIVLGGMMPLALAKRVIETIDFLEEGRRNTLPSRPVLLPGSIDADPAMLGAALLPLSACYFGFERRGAHFDAAI